jgi:hypothetical protein
MNDLAYFSPEYTTARERFRESSVSAGARLDSLTLGAQLPDGNPLTIDTAWLGSPQPQRVFLHTSGLHGVEAFPGCAIQLKLLAEPPAISEDGALVLVHVLNPYGMAYLRRFNEANVDLNRNFLKSDESYSGALDAYGHLNQFINPLTPPSFDFFHLRLLYYFARYGARLKAAIASAQYEYPQGLFFGGKQLQEGPALYTSWVKQHLRNARHVFVVDVHTGLGRWRQESLILRRSSTKGAQLSDALHRELIQDIEKGPVDYLIQGHHSSAFSESEASQEIDFITQEFGTYSPLKVLFALREENRYHHFGDGNLDHPTKKRLKEVFAPASTEWRQSVVRDGISLAESVSVFVFKSLP